MNGHREFIDRQSNESPTAPASAQVTAVALAEEVDRGSATIWAVAGIAALLLLGAMVMEVGAATATRHRADAAADLAALAAAEYATDGEQAACDHARWVAGGMRVHLARCRLAGWNALIEVSDQPTGVLAGFGAATAHAMAGPVDG